MLQQWLNRILNRTYEGNLTLVNFLAKKILKLFGVGRESPIFLFAKRMYRRTGSRIKIHRSYSFNGEDLILARFLPESRGMYLDVGCGNPKSGSNTYLFYKRGWKGTCVDPIGKLILRHRLLRPRDRQILGAISDKVATYIFYEFEESDFSTISIDRSNDLQREGFLVKKTSTIQAINFSELGVLAEPMEPYFLDVDIEGGELPFLESIDWRLFRPRVVAVEEWDSPIYRKTGVRRFLESQGYRLEARAHVTSIYVHGEYLNTSNR